MKKEKLVNVTIDLDDDILIALALEAHKRNITLNELCNKILKDYISKMKKI